MVRSHRAQKRLLVENTKNTKNIGAIFDRSLGIIINRIRWVGHPQGSNAITRSHATDSIQP